MNGRLNGGEENIKEIPQISAQIRPSLLLVDDEQRIQRTFKTYLERAGYDVLGVSCLKEAREAFLQKSFDAVLLDLNLPDGYGIEWIPELRSSNPSIAIVVISGVQDLPVAVEAMRLGADNFLTKPVKLEALDMFLRKSMEIGTLRRNQQSYQRMSRSTEPFFGQCFAMEDVIYNTKLACQHSTAVLLQGETGSGKGMFARWIHQHSEQKNGPFVQVNCSGLHGELLASELFGHSRGAYTGAVQNREGLIGVANGGTLFLDEIGDMDANVQAQFLKVIEERQYRRLGENTVRQSSFRLICATNRDLKEESEKNNFRPDLYFRIHIFPIHIPPLRERLEDLVDLVAHILKGLDAESVPIDEEVFELLRRYQWPGNIRELHNVLERALLLSSRQHIRVNHFPGVLVQPPAQREHNDFVLGPIVEVEAAHIQKVLTHFDGDTRKSATVLGISRPTLYRKIKQFGLSSKG